MTLSLTLKHIAVTSEMGRETVERVATGIRGTTDCPSIIALLAWRAVPPYCADGLRRSGRGGRGMAIRRHLAMARSVQHSGWVAIIGCGGGLSALSQTKIISHPIYGRVIGESVCHVD